MTHIGSSPRAERRDLSLKEDAVADGDLGRVGLTTSRREVADHRLTYQWHHVTLKANAITNKL